MPRDQEERRKRIDPEREVDQWTEGGKNRRMVKRVRDGRTENGPPVTSLTFYRYPVDWAENLTNWFRPSYRLPSLASRLTCFFPSQFGTRSAAGYTIGQLT